MKMALFRIVTPPSRRLKLNTLTMEAASTSETSNKLLPDYTGTTPQNTATFNRNYYLP
jgi:hypothetical protein